MPMIRQPQCKLGIIVCANLFVIFLFYLLIIDIVVRVYNMKKVYLKWLVSRIDNNVGDEM